MSETTRHRTLTDPAGCYRARCLRRGAWVLRLRSCTDANDATFDARLPAYVRRTLADDLGPLSQFTRPEVPVEVSVTRGARITWRTLDGGNVQHPTGPTLSALLAGPMPGYRPTLDAVQA